MVLFITTLRFVTGAIVTVYTLAIGPCNLFQKCNLFHHMVIQNDNKEIANESLAMDSYKSVIIRNKIYYITNQIVAAQSLNH